MCNNPKHIGKINEEAVPPKDFIMTSWPSHLIVHLTQLEQIRQEERAKIN